MEPIYLDETYRRPDGVRDVFRWSRFSEPRLLVVGLLLAVALVLFSSRDPSGATAREGVDVGSHVAATCVRMASGLGQ